jgi:DNA-binding NarL/FixJ family response regulator
LLSIRERATEFVMTLSDGPISQLPTNPDEPQRDVDHLPAAKSEEKPTTIVLADAHAIFRRGLRALFDAESDFVVVGEASDGQEALDLIERHQPDVVVLELLLPMVHGLDVLRAISQRSPKTQSVVISMNSTIECVGAALKAGATCYVLKKGEEKNLLRAVRAAAAGQRFLSPLLDHAAVNDYVAQSDAGSGQLHDLLTPREHEVMQLTALGQTSNQIANRLHISPRTVEAHRANLMRKLKVNNLSDLIRYALLHCLIPLDN